jgi:hypothetical protein
LENGAEAKRSQKQEKWGGRIGWLALAYKVKGFTACLSLARSLIPAGLECHAFVV